jgi:ABC-type Fe3+ transport system substrate-binding protein
MNGFGRVVLGLSLLLGAQPVLAQSFAGVTLRVATYGGGFDKAVEEDAGKQFEATGGKIEYVIGSPADHLAKLIASRGAPVPIDVFDVADTTLEDALDGGFLQKIDPKTIANIKELLPSQYTDYVVAGWSSQDGIMYNTQRFAELGIPAPVQYEDLLDPKLKGRVEGIDLETPGSIHMIVAVSKNEGGDEQHLDAGFAWLKKLGAIKYYKVGSEGLLSLMTGQVDAVTTSAGFALQGAQKGFPVAFVHPKIGTQKGFNKINYIGIARGTPNAAAAAYFINCYLSTSAQFILAQRRGVIPANADARAQLARDPMMSKFFILDQQGFANMMTVDWSKIDQDKFAERWNAAIAH